MDNLLFQLYKPRIFIKIQFKEPGLNKWNNNCKETGGGMNDMDRPSTPTGDEIVSNGNFT